MAETEFPFVGRDRFLCELFLNWQRYKLFNVHGMRSVGKSRTIREFFKRLIDCTTVFQFIETDLRQAKSLERFYIKLQSEFGLPIPSTGEKVHWIESVALCMCEKADTNYVLLFDNAEDAVESSLLNDLEDITTSLIKACPNVRIFITSTTAVDIGNHTIQIKLSPMLHNEAVQLLTTVCPVELFGEHIHKVAELCEGLPLALLMAGAELSEGFLKAEEMVTLLSECRLAALSREEYSEDDRVGDVYHQFILRLTDVFRTRLAELGYIPGTFTVRQASELLGSQTMKQTLDETLQPLNQRNMIDLNPATQRYDLHGILRDCLSMYSTIKNVREIRYRFCRIFSDVMKEISSRMSTSEYLEALCELELEYPNLQKLMTEIKHSTHDIYPFFVEIADKSAGLIQMFMGANCTSFFEKCLEVTVRFGTKDHEAVIRISLGGALTNTIGNPKDGEKQLQSALTILERRPLCYHLALIYQRLGWNMLQQGRYEEANRLLMDALSAELSLGMVYEDLILSTFSSLGIVNAVAGNFEFSEKCHLESLKRRKTKLNTEDHYSIGSCHNNLGVLFELIKNKQKALFHYKKGLDIKKRTKAPDNIIIPSLANVAMQYSALGDNDSAIEHLDEAMQRLEKMPGQRNVSYFSTLENYGKVYYRQGNYRKAVDILEKLLEARVQNKTTWNLTYVATLVDIGKAYHCMDRHQKAIQKYEEAVSMQHRINSQSPKNLYIYEAHQGLFDEFTKLKNFDKVETAYQETYAELQRLAKLSHDPTTTLRLKKNLLTLDEQYKDIEVCRIK